EVLATVLARADVVGQLFVCEIHKTVRGVPANRTWSKETGLPGWACEIRTQKRRRGRPRTDSKMILRSRGAQTMILAASSALALMMATAGIRAHAEGNLDASYTISFARIPVGEITVTAIFGQNEYAISARARAGGVLKALRRSTE